MIYPFHHEPSSDDVRDATPVPIVCPPLAPPAIVYRLEECCQLPLIDSTKSVKDVVFSKPALVRYNACIRALRPALRIGFAVGLLMTCAGSFFNQAVGSVVYVVSSILILFPTLVAILALRFDMVVLLASTYEFWYFSLVSLSSVVMLGANYGDQRASLFVTELFLYEFALLMDANSRGVRGTITASITGAGALLMFVVLEELGQVKDYGNVAIFSYGTWQFHGSDVVATGLSNLSMILLRNAYRKRLAVKKINRHQATVRCISYRTHLRFAEVITAHAAATEESPRLSRISSVYVSATQATTSQLRLVPLSFQIYADDFVQQQILLPTDASPISARVWIIIGLLGLATTIASVASNVDRNHGLWLACLSFGCSLAFMLRCVAFHNRRLLLHMLWSFDFMFLSLQSHIAHAVVCHLLRWDAAKCLVVWASCCWMHWVLTQDLLTPVVRKRLGIDSRWLPIIALVFQLCGQIWLVRELLFSRSWHIDDRELVSFVVGGKTVTVSAIPLLLTRMMTTFCWCLRLLWRLWFRSEDELIMIQGAVEYDDYDMLRRIEAAKRGHEALSISHSRNLRNTGRVRPGLTR